MFNKKTENGNENNNNHSLKDYFKLVKKGYSSPHVVYKYLKSKLWFSEELLINKYFKAKSKILDIGCGCGRTSFPLKKMGYNITAIDLSKDMIESANYQSQIHNIYPDFKVMNVCNLDFDDESFDNALFSYNGLECVPKVAGKLQALKEIYRVLKKDSYFIFTIHSGLPFNSIWYIYLYHFVEYLRNKLSLNKEIKYNFGERYDVPGVPESTYVHVISTFKWDSLLKEVGFKKIYFNSQYRIESTKKPNIFTRFESGNLFYVVKK